MNQFNEVVKQAINQHAPKAIAGLMIKHVVEAQAQSQLTPKQFGHVNNALQQLKQQLSQFMTGFGLSQDPQSEAIIGQIINTVKPHLMQAAPQALQSQQDLWGRQQTEDDKFHQQLEQVPYIKKNPQAPAVPSVNDSGQHPNGLDIPLHASILTESLVKLAGEADAAGMTAHADRIDALLPAMQLMKAAQYEGFQNYWIANGRAFEMAYKKKIEQKMTPHDAWFAVLEEFQDSLLSSQADFVEKYAKRDLQGERAALHRIASNMFMSKISDKMASGSKPGVAFYEALDEFATGRHTAVTLASITKIAGELKASGNESVEAAAKEVDTKVAGVWDSMKSMLGFGGGMGASWANPGGGLMDGLMPYANGGEVVSEFQKIRHQWENTVRPWLSGVAPHQSQVSNMEFNKHVRPMMSALKKVVDMGSKAGFNIKVPTAPSVEKAGLQVIVNKADLARFTQELFQDLSPFMDDQLAMAIQKKMQSGGKPRPDFSRIKKNPAPAAAPAPATPTSFDPAPTGQWWNNKGSQPTAAAPRLAPHEMSALEKAIGRNGLPPDVKGKLMQFLGHGAARAASTWSRTKAAQLDSSPPISVQPPSTPGQLPPLSQPGSGGGKGDENIRAALHEFFSKEYPGMEHFFINPLMRDISAELGAKDSPPEAEPAPAPVTTPPAPVAPQAATPPPANEPPPTPATHSPTADAFKATLNENEVAPPVDVASPPPAPAPFSGIKSPAAIANESVAAAPTTMETMSTPPVAPPVQAVQPSAPAAVSPVGGDIPEKTGPAKSRMRRQPQVMAPTAAPGAV